MGSACATGAESLWRQRDRPALSLLIHTAMGLSLICPNAKFVVVARIFMNCHPYFHGIGNSCVEDVHEISARRR